MKALFPVLAGRSRFKEVGAFSLIEVVMSLGVVTFCLIPLLGMMPVGFRLVKDANERAAAANAITFIASSLRNATSANNADFSGKFGNTADAITYTLGGASKVNNEAWSSLSLDGLPSKSSNEGRIKAYVEIKKTPTLSTPGQALVSVAWPAVAKPVFSNGKWSRAQGSLTVAIQFMPNL